MPERPVLAGAGAATPGKLATVHRVLNVDLHGRRYWPLRAFEKVAVLVPIADAQQLTEIAAPFGRQRMVGGFYIVGDDEGAYGVARSVFEATHEQVGPHRWIKNKPVTAVRVTEAIDVATMIDDHEETRVTAQAGDWLVQQGPGDVQVVGDEQFRRRYTSVDPR